VNHYNSCLSKFNLLLNSEFWGLALILFERMGDACDLFDYNLLYRFLGGVISILWFIYYVLLELWERCED
jgi:hypothetical protein